MVYPDPGSLIYILESRRKGQMTVRWRCLVQDGPVTPAIAVEPTFDGAGL